MRNRIILLLIGFMCYAGMGNAQEDKTEKAVPAIVSDSVEVAAPDSTVPVSYTHLTLPTTSRV